MSFMNPTDMVEEDAADLQFPKDVDCINLVPSASTKHTVQYYRPQLLQANSNTSSANLGQNCCATCKQSITEPFIKCPECAINLCLHCFSSGAETQLHRNTHSYIVVHDNIQVFTNTNWTAREEKLFLNAMLSCGYGNWPDIAKAVCTRTADECRDHYHTCYFDGIFRKLIGLSSDTYFPERLPYVYKMRSMDPPRFDTVHSHNMAGYRCARGEFDTPFDNSAESLISSLDDLSEWSSEYKSVGENLQCAIVRAYNHRLSERERRYKVVRDNGLLMSSRTMSWIARNSDAFEAVLNRNGTKSNGRLLAFMQITNGMKFDMLVEGLQYFAEIRKYLFRLYECRTNGVKTLQGGRLYYKQKNKRIARLRDKKIEQVKQLYDWRILLPDASQNYVPPTLAAFSNNPRKKSAPIDIIGLPSYEKLTEDERTLCSVERLMPAAYLEYKDLFIAENTKAGSLTLARARQLIKIDVNKIRQIYDFLLAHGHVNKPPN